MMREVSNSFASHKSALQKPLAVVLDITASNLCKVAFQYP